MNPIEISKASLVLLDKVLVDAHELSPQEPTLESSRIAFCYRHGQNVRDLGNDMLCLLSVGRFVGATILIRPMLESMFNVSAAYRNEHFHIEKQLGDLEKTVSWLTLNFPNPDNSILEAIKWTQAEIDDLTKHFGGVISGKRWQQIYEIAKAGGEERHYKKDYAYLCDYTHAKITGLVRHEEGLGRGNALQTATTAIIVTSAILCGVLTLKDKISPVKEALELTHKLNEAIQDGSLNALDNQGSESQTTTD